MTFVLEQVVSEARERALALAAPSSPEASSAARPSLRAAIAGKDRLSIVAEFKRRSPSRGALAEGASVAERVGTYEAAGASAVSVLTEPTRFGGSYEDLREARASTTLPLLMKDFIVTARQIEHAATLGASGVLLIARCLAARELGELVQVCAAVGLDPLIECADAEELARAQRFEDAVLGVNNRDLRTLEVDPGRSARLLAELPADRVAIAESGFLTPGDLDRVRGLADAALVGTALMSSPDPARFLREGLA
ncbi:MAG: indole-3-glycerol-phosphate synthase [Planctomycetota bacterium]